MEKPKTEELVTEAKNFFNSYRHQLGESIRSESSVVVLPFQEISLFSPMLAEHILQNPTDAFAIMEVALQETGLKKKSRVRLLDAPKTIFTEIRNIRAKHLNQLLWIDGIVRNASAVRPQVVNARFECPSCGAIMSILQVEKKFREPSRCSCGRKAFFKHLSNDMVDAQRLVIEEASESLIGGEQPRRIDVFLKEDLVDPKMEERTTPGSRIRVFGILKEVQLPLQTGGIKTQFDLMIEANNIVPLEESFQDLEISDEDERQIQELAVDPEVFDKLSRSIATSVHGHTDVKKVLVLQMFGGCKKERADGTRNRGDMHVLLVGDPGVAKSVMLKFISTIAPKGRYVAGKSATGAGITATVVRDDYLKGWSLEAGAMVLANKGIICIDELEKMDPQDRSAMHEALEQQTVTVSKANVQATLRAETSVLAAANPKFGRFDPIVPVPVQIDLPATLLNRFDVMFIMRDLPDRHKDEAIATHVLTEHQNPGAKSVIERDLFRKYIAYAKQKIKPRLTDEAIEEIKRFYVDLRSSSRVLTEGGGRTIPISARQLEALIRMSEAHAKVRLRKEVKKEDAIVAIEIMKSYLMQCGYDHEMKTFDIDRITTGISSSQRKKISLVRDIIFELEKKFGKKIPVEEIEKALGAEISSESIEGAIGELHKSGDIFEPEKGFVQRI